MALCSGEHDAPFAEPQMKPSRPQEPLLGIESVCKSFGGTAVLQDVTFTAARGEILMLVGENGAGKSTIKNILSGLIAPDSGAVRLAGRTLAALSPADADRFGIGTIHQELSLFENLCVAENIHLPHLPQRFGRVDRRRMEAQTRAVLHERLGAAIDPWALVEDLSLGERQMVEIAKAIHRSSSLLILDEPTTCLSLPERARLFDAVRRLRDHGYAIVYITHFMEEVYELGDRITVLRDGRVIGTGAPQEIPREVLMRMMVGRDLGESSALPASVAADTQVMLKVERLSDGVAVHDVSFELRAGEILGLAGLMGAGRTEIAELLLGLRHGEGTVTLVGRSFPKRSPRAAMERGLVMVSEDRRRDQAFLSRTVRENLTVATLPQLASAALGLLALKPERQAAARAAAMFHVDHPGLEAFMLALSGGNQQKAIVARWLQRAPSVCILDEPTKGVDIGARAEMHRLIRAQASNGVAFLLISSDLPELIGLAHRVLVLHKGRVVGALSRAEAEPHHILALASTGRAA
jgi:ribose transport system ATP-binding protein